MNLDERLDRLAETCDDAGTARRSAALAAAFRRVTTEPHVRYRGITLSSSALGRLQGAPTAGAARRRCTTSRAA